MTDAEQLKPCPLCGGAPNITSHHDVENDREKWTVACGGANAPEGWPDHYVSVCGDFNFEAIAAWNRRPNPSGDADVREAVAREAKHTFGPYLPDGFTAAHFVAFTDRVLTLTGNASTDRAGTQACKAEVSPNLQTSAPQGGGEALGRNLYEAFWKRNGGNEPAWCDQSNAIRNMWDAIADDALAALKPQTPDVLGEVRDTSDSVNGLAEGLSALRGHIAAIQSGKRAVEAGKLAPKPDPILECVNDLPRIVALLNSALFEIESAFEAYEDATPPGDVLGGEGEWIFWSGGPNPVPGDKVVIKRRDGETKRQISDLFDWLQSPSRTDPSDIVSYMRLAARPSQSDEGEKT